MIACTSTASASRRKSTFPSTPRLRSSPRTSMLSLTTSSPPRASTVFAREDDAVVSLSLDLCYTTSWDSTQSGPSCLRPLHLSQQRFRHLHMLRHADLAVHSDGLSEQLTGLRAVAGPIPIEKHAGVPAAHLRLLDLVRQLVDLAQGGLIVRLRLLPLSSGGRSDPRNRLKRSAPIPGHEGTRANGLDHEG